MLDDPPTVIVLGIWWCWIGVGVAIAGLIVRRRDTHSRLDSSKGMRVCSLWECHRTSHPETSIMATVDANPRAVLSFDVQVGEGGRVEFSGPFQPGQRLTVVVIGEPHPEFSDLTAAAASSLAFWDNPLDDEDWNAPAAG